MKKFIIWGKYWATMTAALIKYLRARNRIYWGFCPICNSDAPELYNCLLCNGYHTARGDSWPKHQTPRESIREVSDLVGFDCLNKLSSKRVEHDLKFTDGEAL